MVQTSEEIAVLLRSFRGRFETIHAKVSVALRINEEQNSDLI